MKPILICSFLALVAFHGPPAARCQSTELRTTEWGSLRAVSGEPGVYQLQVTQWPADGILQFNDVISHVTRCAREARGESRSIDFSFAPDSHRLILHADHLSKGERGQSLRIETSSSTQQTEDGRILFHPRDAQLKADQLRLIEANEQVWIGTSWTTAQDQLTWSFNATRWGQYRLLLTYATDSESRPSIEVQMGEERHQSDLPSTGGLQRFRTADMGIVSIPREGAMTVSVRCLEGELPLSLNLKSVELLPACEGTPPVASADNGIVTLHGRDSIVRSVTMRYEPADIKQTLGYWVRPTDRAEWWFTTHAPGTYNVEVWQGCGTGQGGSRVAVTVNNETLEFTVEDTGHFQNFKPRVIGQISLTSPGKHLLKIQPIQIAKSAALDVRQIRLLPVAIDSPRELILPGDRLQVAGRPGFIFLPPESLRKQPQPWVFYAPTLADVPDVHEKWMHEQFLAAGVAVAGIDIGEGYGSPLSDVVLTAFYQELVARRGFAAQPCLLGRSRGGLWMSSWAASHPEWVSGLAGIYPVFDLSSYPGIERAASAYDLSADELAEQLTELNPIERIASIAAAKVPVFLIHGDQDEVVPIEKNSAALQARYRAAGSGDLVTLEVVKGQGHNFWEGFFRSQTLVDFVIARARAGR